MTKDQFQDCLLDNLPRVDNLAELAVLDIDSNSEDCYQPRGHTTPGDVPMPIYHLQPANGRVSSGKNGVFVSSKKSGWIWVAQTNGKLDIRYWGARAGRDNLAAIQAANNHSSQYGGTAWIPNGVWEHSKPIIVRNDSRIEGQSQDAVLRNTHDGSRNVTMKATFFLGCHHPAQNYKYQFFDCQPANQGSQNIILKDPSNARFLTVGKCVFIQSADHVSAGPRRLPVFQETKRIVSISGGIITFDRPLDNTYSAPKITDPQGAQRVFGYVPSFILDRATIRNLSVETDGGRWCIRTGTYDCLFENIRVLKSDSLIYGNSFYRTVFRNIVGSFSARMIEVASGAGFLRMEGIHGTFLDRGENLSQEPVIRAGEYSRNITLDGWSVVAQNYFASSLIKIQASHFKILNGKVNITGITGSLIQFSSDRASKMTFSHNTISDCDIYSEGARRFIRFGGKNGIQPERNTVSNVKFRGSLRRGGDAINGSSKFNEVKDCWFEEGVIDFDDRRFIKNTFIRNSFHEANKGIYEYQNLVRNERRVCAEIINTQISQKFRQVSAPQTNCEICRTTLPATPFIVGDGYYAFLRGTVKNGIGACHVSLLNNDVELGHIEFRPGEIGDFGIEATMYSQSTGGKSQLWIVKLIKQGKVVNNVIHKINVNHLESIFNSDRGRTLIFQHTQPHHGDELVISELEMEPRLIGVNVQA